MGTIVDRYQIKDKYKPLAKRLEMFRATMPKISDDQAREVFKLAEDFVPTPKFCHLAEVYSFLIEN